MTKANIDMGDNLTDAAAALAGEPLDPTPQKAAPKKAAKPAAEVKVKIMLEDNDQIPPGGQFIQVDGRSFLIQAGHEVEVPRSVVDVLDHAIMSVAVTDDYNSVIGYRDRLRFPYRVITEARRGS